MKLAIIGHGFVGKAVDYGFSDPRVEKFIVDPQYENGLKIQDLVDKDIDICFVCVPTPMHTNGAVDASIVKDTVSYLKENVTGLIVIKSTIPPDITEHLTINRLNNRVIYNPEFLTEKNANEDFVNPKMHILGGDRPFTEKLEHYYEEYSLCKPCPVYHMSASDASFVKYGINCFLASKVLWFNQFFDVVKNFGGNFTKIINAISTDPRIGSSHTRVPGFDGKRGYGGACFPKDTAAFSHFAQDFTVLDKVIEENNNYRRGYEKDDREKEQNVNYG